MAFDLVQGLAQKGIHEVPSRFVQPVDKRPSPLLTPPDGGVSFRVPLIDMKDLMLHQQDKQEGSYGSEEEEDEHWNSFAEEVASACKEWGFFQIVNHGVDVELLEKVKRVVDEFLQLPMEEKTKHPMKFEPYHPTGYGRLFDFSEETVLDWVDALIHYLAPPQLKDPDYWPDEPSDFRETIERYGAQVQRLVRFIVGVLSRKLGLSMHRLEEAFGGDDMQVVLRVNHYPHCPQADLVMGLSPHSDGSAITVLLQDEIEGLQVKKDGGWWTVKPVPGALIVNMGDMMQLISNGQYLSMEHRAVVSKEKDRVSVVLFYAPWVDAVIAPLGEGSNNPVYRETKYGDYLATYMNKELSGKDRINSFLINS